MGKIYKSTIVVYSDCDFSANNIHDLLDDLTGEKAGSMCHIWTVAEIDEEELYQEDRAEEILFFFGLYDDELLELDKDPSLNLYDDDEYEFYPNKD